MYAPLILTVAFLTHVPLLALAEPATTTAPIKAPYPPQTNYSASIEIRALGEQWTFLSTDCGLSIYVDSNAGNEYVRPESFKAIRNVRRIVATSREISSTAETSFTYFAVGIESVSADGSHLEYWLILSQDDPSMRGRKERVSNMKVCIATRRPIDDPADTMSIGLPGGDSIMLTLTDLTRIESSANEVTTHTYLNDFTMGNEKADSAQLLSYKSSTSVKLPKAQWVGSAQHVDVESQSPWFTKIPKPSEKEVECLSPLGDAQNPPTREAAMSLLLGTNTFADDAIGDGGDISAQVVAFQVILRDPEAAAAFRWLLQHANTAGRLYALCGLRIADRAAFDREITTYRSDKTKLRMQSGCSIDTVTVAEIVESKGSCAARLAPGQSPQDWAKQNKCEWYSSDIFGGGYSWDFSHAGNSTAQSKTTEPQSPWYSRIHPRPPGKPGDGDKTPGGKSTKEMTREIAFETLLNTTTFAGTAIGFTGATSAQVAAFRILIKEPEAIGIFRDLQKRAQKAGQLYALCGLRLMDRTTFGAVIDKYRLDKSEVQTLFGCIGAMDQVKNIVEKDDKCTVRLEGNQTPDDWLKAHDCKSVFYDIMGGGYPWQFAQTGRTKSKAP